MTTATGSGYTPGFLSQITSNIEKVPNLFVYWDSSNNPNFTNSQAWGKAALATGATGGDAIATILGANYISDGQKRGLALGDFVLIITDYVSVGTDVGRLAFVSAVQATTSGYGVTVTLISTS
jgi:hypothetical protein